MSHHFDLLLQYLVQFPEDPQPSKPPGSEQILAVVSNIKWAAGIGLVAGFFIGLLVWAGGRWVDHHRAGRIGVIMMVCAIAGGLLYGIGYQVITHFAGVS